MKNLQAEIGKRMQDIRNKYYANTKLSAAAFAELLGESKHNIGNYERGIANVPNRVLVELYRLGFNPTWVLTGEGSPCTKEILSDFGLNTQAKESPIKPVITTSDLSEQIKDAVRAAAGDIAAILREDLKK